MTAPSRGEASMDAPNEDEQDVEDDAEEEDI
jgi:hypothetical protein